MEMTTIMIEREKEYVYNNYYEQISLIYMTL